MALETLHNQIDIRELSVEQETGSRLLFEPHRDIYSPEWEAMQAELETLRVSPPPPNHEVTYISHASAMKLLFPDRMDKTKFDKDKIKQEVRKIRDEEDIALRMKQLADLKLLAQDTFGEVIVRNTLHTNIREELERWRNKMPHSRFALNDYFTAAQAYKIIASQKMAEFILTEGDWEHGLARLGACRMAQAWAKFAKMAVCLRILFPDRFAELGIDRATMDVLKHELHTGYRISSGEISAYTFTELARDLYLLSVKDIIVTEKGLQLKITSDEEQSPGSVPASRKF